MPDDPFANDYQHQRIMRQIAVIDEMKETIAKQRMALLLIQEWKMPYKHFGLEQGSNGERDYFREVARKALSDEQNNPPKRPAFQWERHCGKTHSQYLVPPTKR